MTPNPFKTSSPRPLALRRLKAKKLSRYFLLFVLLATAVIFFNVIKFFLVPAMLAAVFAGIFYPLYQRLLKLFRQHKGASAFVCCLILLLGLLIPAYLVANLVSREAGIRDLLIFFSTLGGIYVFGLMGFIVGPLLAALFVTILDIYSIEFRAQLEMIDGFIAESQAEKIMAPAEGQAPEGKNEVPEKNLIMTLHRVTLDKVHSGLE